MIAVYIFLTLAFTVINARVDSDLVMVDMTHKFDKDTINWLEQPAFVLDVITNGTVADGYWLQIESYFSGVHVGTHFDAPCHLAKGRWCVDEVPFERLVAPAAVIDITDRAQKDPDAQVLVEDLLKWEETYGETLNGTIVVMRSGWGERWGDRAQYLGTSGYDTSKLHFPGMSATASQWLVDNRDINGFAVDSLSLDYGPSKKKSTHKILLGNNIYGMEMLANVEKIPKCGATLYVMPMKIAHASGAPLRIFATYPKVISGCVPSCDE